MFRLRVVWIVCYWMRFVHLGISLRLRKWISRQVSQLPSHDAVLKSKVLVQVASWNSEKTLQAALESLIEQTHNNWVAVVYDDGSDDGSRDLLNRLALQDERIIPVYGDGSNGVNHSRNEILRTAENLEWDIITVLDSDDVAEPFFLADGVELMSRGAFAVRCWNARYDFDLKTKHYEFLACAQVFVSRGACDILGSYKPKPYTADDDFMERLEKLAVLQRGVICQSRRVLQRMRVHEKNLSRTKGDEVRERMEAKSRRESALACRISTLHVPLC